jgi:hypothetical protein
MQDHGSDRWPAFLARPGTPEFEHQRRLLLELVAAPPAEGDSPVDLADVLGFPVEAIEAAADALIAAGLAERHVGRLFPSPATLAIDALWPVAM